MRRVDPVRGARHDRRVSLRCPLCHGPLDDTSPDAHRCEGCQTPFHAGCHRELGGCSTLGCALHVPAAAPATASKAAPTRRRSFFASGVVIVLSWLATPIFGELAILLAALGVALRLKGGRRQALAALMTPLALPLYAATNATVQYMSGSATLRSVGLPGLTARNLDPTLRCRHRSTGCVPGGLTLLWDAPNNLTLRVLGAVFGTMPYAYDGPYPTAEEAVTAARAATVRPTWDQLEGGVTVGGRSVQLGEDVTYRFCGTHWVRDARARVALTDERLLVVADEHAHDDPRDPCVLLFDTRTSQLVAFYPGEYSGK